MFKESFRITFVHMKPESFVSGCAVLKMQRPASSPTTSRPQLYPTRGGSKNLCTIYRLCMLAGCTIMASLPSRPTDLSKAHVERASEATGTLHGGRSNKKYSQQHLSLTSSSSVVALVACMVCIGCTSIMKSFMEFWLKETISGQASSLLEAPMLRIV